MRVSVGTSLSSLSMGMLKPKSAHSPSTEDGAFGLRVLSAAEREERQKAQELVLANMGEKTQSEMDTFFLKFTAHRERAISENVIRLAKLMEGSADEHILTTNSDPGIDELKRLGEKYQAEPGVKQTDFEAEDYQPLTPEEIEAVAEHYELTNPAGEKPAEKLP